MLTPSAQILNKKQADDSSLDYAVYNDLCKIVGTNLTMTQGAGCNISVKISNGQMIVKASGTELFDSKFVTIRDWEKIKERLQKNLIHEENEIWDLQIEPKDKGKPSLEGYFHCLTKKFTVHYHSVLAISALDSVKNNLKELYNAFDKPVDVFPYKQPGLELANALAKKPDLSKIVFLEKHGVIVHSDSYEEVISLINEVESICAAIALKTTDYSKKASIEYWMEIGEQACKIQRIYEEVTGQIPFVMHCWGLKDVLCTPDCVIYSGLGWQHIDNAEMLKQHFVETGEIPSCIYYENEQYIVAPNSKKASQTYDVICIYNVFCSDVESLSHSECLKLLNLDTEKYRKSLNG